MSRHAVILVRNTGRHDARVARIARTLRRDGWSTTVLAVVSAEDPDPEIVVDGVPMRRLAPGARLRRGRAPAPATAGATPGPALGGAPARPPAGARSLLARARRLVLSADFYGLAFAVARKERPAVLHCNDWNTMWVGVAARALLGTRVVYDAHELWPDRNGRPEPRAWLLACEWLFVRAAHAVMTTSPAYAAVMERRYGVVAQVVRNLPDSEPPALNGGPPADPPTAVYVGGVTTSRGLEQALEALARVPGLRLRIVGTGRPDYLAQLTALAERLSVADRVRFEGPVAPADVPAAAASAHVGLALIQPDFLSYELTLPNKLFEYLAAGVPVLASDLPAMREVVEAHGAGRVVAPRDVGAIAAALAEMVRPDAHAALRDAAVAAGRRLSWRHERERLDAVYAAALR